MPGPLQGPGPRRPYARSSACCPGSGPCRAPRDNRRANVVGMNTVERTVRGWLEGDKEPAVRPKVQLSPRISAEHADLLNAVAERLKATKHGLAQDLLEAAIEEAAALVGLQ